MPNWCQNYLTIRGDAGAILLLLKANVGDDDPKDKPQTNPDGPARIARARKLTSAVRYLQICDQPLSMERLLPTPDEFPDKEPEDFQAKARMEGTWDWYTWRIHNWGTKWDLSFSAPGIIFVLDSNPITDDGRIFLTEANGASELLLRFDTAWGPPEAYVKSLAQAYPNLEFCLEYVECGMDFAGRLTICETKQIYQDQELTVEDVLGPEDAHYY